MRVPVCSNVLNQPVLVNVRKLISDIGTIEMNILRKMLMGVVGSAFTLIADLSFATPILSFENMGSDINKSYYVGDTISLDLWVSGLDGNDNVGGSDLGWFDLHFSFNNAVTGYQNTVFSSDLNDSLFFGLSATQTSSNTVNNFGISLLFDLSSQANEFKLFTLVFSADQIGASILQLDNILLADSWANELISDNFFAEINVSETLVDVPEPSGWSLLLGIFALVVVRHRRSLQNKCCQ